MLMLNRCISKHLLLHILSHFRIGQLGDKVLPFFTGAREDFQFIIEQFGFCGSCSDLSQGWHRHEVLTERRSGNG